MPSASSRFARIAPMIEARTISISPALQRHQRDDELGGIAERGVQQAADRITRVRGELAGGAHDERGDGHDGQRRAKEDHRRRQPPRCSTASVIGMNTSSQLMENFMAVLVSRTVLGRRCSAFGHPGLHQCVAGRQDHRPDEQSHDAKAEQAADDTRDDQQHG